jgi:hypothetical protein
MKKLVLSFIVLFAAIQISAQRSYHSPFFYEAELNDLSKPNEAIKASKVKKTKTITTNKKGAHLSKIDYFNENGYLVGGEHYDRKGNITYAFEVHFNDANQPIRLVEKGNRNPRVTLYQYHSSGKLSQIEVYIKDVLQFKHTKTFNNQNKLVETCAYNKKGLTSKSIFTYDDDGKMSLSETFNGKGELIRRYDYSCAQEGEVVNLSKEEKKVCTFDAYENGFLIKIRETIDHKGNVNRILDKFSAGDTSLVETKYQNHKGQTTFVVRYQNNKETEMINFDEKGQERTRWVYVYNQKWQKTMIQFWYKGTFSNETRWYYNEFGLCVRTEFSNAKQKNHLIYETEILERF